MNEQIENFLKALEAALKEIPQEEKDRAVEYYREYLYDACESGMDTDSAIEQAGDAQAIAAGLRMETSIAKARSNPGIRNYGSVVKNTFRLVTTPFAILTLSLLVLVSFSIVVIFFAGALCTFAAAIGALFIMVYEATRIPGQFFLEIIGTLGIGMMMCGILMLFTVLFYKLGELFIRTSVWTITKIQGKPRHYASSTTEGTVSKRLTTKHVICVFSVTSILGLALLFASGLPVRYFNIFNSTKPNDIQLEAFEYNTAEVNAFSIVSAHSIVRITRGTGNKIELLYEKSDWLDYDIKADGKTLYFYEKSNGRLPLFSLVSYHESMTEIQIRIPEGYAPEIVKIGSTGGHVLLTGIAATTQVDTMNGRIEFIQEDLQKTDIVAKTSRGSIYYRGKQAGQKTDKGNEYISVGASDKNITLTSSNGDIYIQ